jgi:long-chain acyl-CoA synthetase
VSSKLDMERPEYSYDVNTLADIATLSGAAFGSAPALGMVGSEASSEKKPLSYEELERLTRRTAAFLHQTGIDPGDRVAILSESRPEWGIASLGIARAAAVSVPILVDFSAEQIGNILAHSGAKAVFVSSKLRRKLEDLQASGSSPLLLPIEDLSLPLHAEDQASAYECPVVKPEELAAIVYTSGTTGLSKGVMLTHRNFIADALSCDSVIRLNCDDVVLSILPLAHTYEYTIGFLIPIMSGSSIRYLDRPPSASALMPALASLRPTIMLTVPLVIEKVFRTAVKPSLAKIGLYKFPPFRPLLERLAGRKLYSSFGGRMRFFGIGGAPLDPEVERFLLHARFPYAIGYGLTETAPIIAASAVGKTALGVAGPPLGDAVIRVVPVQQQHQASHKVSQENNRAPRKGEALIGELQVRGPMVGPGYFRDPERSAEAFLEGGWFRTGDLGYFDSKGRVRVRGRLKTMILGASGENIYPEEVEAVINSVPEVLESLVYDGEEGLIALVHLKPETLEDLFKSGVEGAEKAVNSIGRTVGSVAHNASESIGNAERAASALLDRIKRETNARLTAFSRLHCVKLQVEPFEKTPTQKIKRFMYPRNDEKD